MYKQIITALNIKTVIKFAKILLAYLLYLVTKGGYYVESGCFGWKISKRSRVINL